MSGEEDNIEHEQPIRYNEQPIRYNEQPIRYHEQPIRYHEQPISCNNVKVCYMLVFKVHQQNNGHIKRRQH